VACTGDGELIALKILARAVYGWLEKGIPAIDAVKKSIALFEEDVDIGLIVSTHSDYTAGSRNGMPWSFLTESR